MAFLQNESFYVPSSAVFAWKICRTCDRQRAFLQYDSFREYLGHHASWKKFTLFARIWPFTGMDSFVDIKIAFALERLGALITMQKWIIMNKLVALELRTYLERFPHTLQGNVFWWMWIFLCIFRAQFCLKCFPQSLQGIGPLSVCTKRCFLKITSFDKRLWTFLTRMNSLMPLKIFNSDNLLLVSLQCLNLKSFTWMWTIWWAWT